MMGKVINVFKAILTRIIFSAHGFIAIWRVTSIKGDPNFWYLSISLLLLLFEGIFTLTIKENREWRWFCPSVFLYLSSVVPAIWLLEFDKLDRRLEVQEEIEFISTNSSEELPAIQTFGVEFKIPVTFTAEVWATIIEQVLMLILIIGRWLLPKGDLTREQLSQLLLVYIGTAADIIEFFDSFKDDKIASNRILCIIILSIWSWSLLQFTLVITAPSKPKNKRGKHAEQSKKNTTCAETCCTVDVWSILINIILQDAPFFIFRLLLISYYNIISYMNIFFTAKNTLVIILQFYRLVVVQSERRKLLKKSRKGGEKVVLIKKESKRSEKGKHLSHHSEKKLKMKGKQQRRLETQLSEEEFASPALSSSRLLEKEDHPWKRKGRRKSLSTSNLHEMAEFYYEDEITSNERTSCRISSEFDPDEDPEYEDPDKLKQRMKELRRNKGTPIQAEDDIEEDDEEDEDLANEQLLEEEEDEDDDEEEQEDDEDGEWAMLNARRNKNQPKPLPRSDRSRPLPNPKSDSPASSQRPLRAPSARVIRNRNECRARQVRPSSRNSDRVSVSGSSRARRQDTGYSSASSQQSHKSGFAKQAQGRGCNRRDERRRDGEGATASSSERRARLQTISGKAYEPPRITKKQTDEGNDDI
ncbi:uncharacterized protein LOC136027332 isoform X2 [Artemia franciscana]|uniref:uncharacterized protein LOC136027332 isoform X2 n=1 Tax=Artemia franciscana TaxID=6661 RepID=UPI0032D9DD18